MAVRRFAGALSPSGDMARGGGLTSKWAAVAIALPYSVRIGDSRSPDDIPASEDRALCDRILAELGPVIDHVKQLGQFIAGAVPPIPDKQDDEAVRILLDHLPMVFREALGLPECPFQDGFSFLTRRMDEVEVSNASA